MKTAQEIRKAFLDFFAEHNHHIVPSAPMVVKGDPTLMFTNAGMNQFKDIILGNSEAQYKRVADSQKCLRVSGKHNDLEEVGHDTYHHTMFEMLGNWSFGDYFKQEAIDMAWELLHVRLGIPKERLFATVFEGDAAQNISRDNEAAERWLQYLPAESIINGNKKDNFWEMGETGPCGPCSEIHVDLRSDEEREKVPGHELVNKDHPRVIEVWNLVFMQYNRLADGSLEALPHKVIDTGMGFERLCMVLQGKESTYDTDVFTPLIAAIGAAANRTYGTDDKVDVAMRVVADHIRTIAFAIADGQLPGNAKAGYVIRRILRRAVRYGYTFLNFKQPFIYALVPTLINIMGDAYPELEAQKDLIMRVIHQEEESFLRTLEAGVKLLDKKMDELIESKLLSGKDAFELYDTFGFPQDLTELILREHGFEMDKEGFELEMQQQKERARSAAALKADDWVTISEGESFFVGYDNTQCTTDILRFRKVTHKNKSFFQVVLSNTPFYAEMGGQVGDCGVITDSNGNNFEIFDTKRENNLPVHYMHKLPDDLTDSFTAKIDETKRTLAECNHTATHLLHYALREILGEHVEQKGSFVSPDVLRFDFSHFNKLTPEEIRKIEVRVTEMIRADYPKQEYRNVPIAQAKEMGAMALFGEKYGEQVRVMQYGNSIELCGGTHIPSTGMIGTFRIVSESSIAAGIRRIEAVTAANAENYLYQQEELLKNIKEALGNTPDPLKAVAKLSAEYEQLKKEIKAYQMQQVKSIKEALINSHETVGKYRLFTLNGEYKPEIAKDIAFQLKGEIAEPFAFVAATYDGIKSMLTVLLSDEVVANGHNAATLVKNAAKLIQGGGGGQPHFATAGGKGSEGLSNAIAQIVAELSAAQ